MACEMSINGLNYFTEISIVWNISAVVWALHFKFFFQNRRKKIMNRNVMKILIKIVIFSDVSMKIFVYNVLKEKNMPYKNVEHYGKYDETED